MNLSERKLKVLEKIIDNYILTGNPIGSKRLCNDLEVSSSTIRSDMAELTSLGLLEQPYTSAGRIPSKKGYKIYIDRLLENESFTKKNNDVFSFKNMCSPEEFLRKSLNTIANSSKCVAVSIVSPKDVKIKDIQLIFMRKKLIMAVLITSNGNVEKKIIFCEQDLTNEEIYYMSNIIKERFLNLELSKINSQASFVFSENLEKTFPIFSQIISSIINLAKEASGVFMYSKGEANLFLNSGLDQNSIANAISFLDSPADLLNFLENNSQRKIDVLIGKEGDVLNFENFSIVTSKYEFLNHDSGTIALIGPIRMNYAKVISDVRNLVLVLNNFLNLED